MSCKGDCWDNARSESFFKTLEVELAIRFASRAEACREVFDCIEGFDDTWRLHGSLGYLGSAEFERLSLQARETPLGPFAR